MDRNNDDIFSPIRKSDEEKKKRSSDSFSEFLKGPDAFRKSSTKIGENVNEKTLSIKSISSKAPQDKSIKTETKKDEVISLSSSIFDEEAFVTCLDSRSSWKNVDKADNLQSDSAKNHKDFSNTSLTAKYKQIKDHQSISQHKTERKHASNTNILQLLSNKKSLQANASIISKALAPGEIKKTKCPASLSQCNPLSQLHSVESSVKSETDVVSIASGSKEIKKTEGSSSSSQPNLLSRLHSDERVMHSRAAVASEATRSKEIKKTDCPSSLSQQNPLSELCSDESSSVTAAASESFGCKEIKKTLCSSSSSHYKPLSEIQSRIEKMVSDAVESQVDDLQQLMWSHHYSLLKALHETKETLENRHASERETLCKIMEELAEENRQLRNAASGH